MPHDKNGALLNVGDRVSVEFTVKEIQMAEDYCNTTLVIPGEHGPHNVTSTLVLNAKQTTKVADGPTSAVQNAASDQADGATGETATNEQAQELVDSGEAQPGPEAVEEEKTVA